jgi:transposase InsO family protein
VALPPHFVEAAFRYRLIAPLLDDSLSRGERLAWRDHVLGNAHEHPTRGRIRVRPRTLRRWLTAYRRRKLDGLCPGGRSNGRSRAIPKEALDLAQQLVEENPRRNTVFLIAELEHKFGDLRGRVKKSTLNRHLHSRDVSRRVPRSDATPAPPPAFVPFEAPKPNHLWQSDIHFGPPALVDGRAVPTKIIAWLDDFSRRCCHCQAYPNETLPMLEDCLKQAMQKCGIPRLVYTDNGSVYSGIQFALICADLGITPFTSQPYSPWTHGKVERLWGVQEDQLWSEIALLDPMPIEKLNGYLQAWVEVKHHQHIHSQTGQPPLQRWEQHVRDIRYPSLEQIKRVFWLWERRHVTPTSLVKLHCNEYAVDPAYADQWMLVRYDPYDLTLIQLWTNEKRPQLRGEFTAERPLVRREAPRPDAPPRDRRKPSEAAQRALDNLQSLFEEHQQASLGLIQFPRDPN